MQRVSKKSKETHRIPATVEWTQKKGTLLFPYSKSGRRFNILVPPASRAPPCPFRSIR